MNYLDMYKSTHIPNFGYVFIIANFERSKKGDFVLINIFFNTFNQHYPPFSMFFSIDKVKTIKEMKDLIYLHARELYIAQVTLKSPNLIDYGSLISSVNDTAEIINLYQKNENHSALDLVTKRLKLQKDKMLFRRCKIISRIKFLAIQI